MIRTRFLLPIVTNTSIRYCASFPSREPLDALVQKVEEARKQACVFAADPNYKNQSLTLQAASLQLGAVLQLLERANNPNFQDEASTPAPHSGVVLESVLPDPSFAKGFVAGRMSNSDNLTTPLEQVGVESVAGSSLAEHFVSGVGSVASGAVDLTCAVASGMGDLVGGIVGGIFGN